MNAEWEKYRCARCHKYIAAWRWEREPHMRRNEVGYVYGEYDYYHPACLQAVRVARALGIATMLVGKDRT